MRRSLGLKEDIDRMVKWADNWQMEFNPEKCEVIHFGRSTLTRKYSMNGRTLESFVEQRDLGVFVHRSLKVEGHVSKVVKKAYGTPASINRGIDYKSREVMLELYRTLVRPPLECSSGQHIIGRMSLHWRGHRGDAEDAAWDGTFKL